MDSPSYTLPATWNLLVSEYAHKLLWNAAAHDAHEFGGSFRPRDPGEPLGLCYWKCNFPMSPYIRALVCWSVCHNFLYKAGKLHIHRSYWGTFLYLSFQMCK